MFVSVRLITADRAAIPENVVPQKITGWTAGVELRRRSRSTGSSRIDDDDDDDDDGDDNDAIC